MKLYMHPVSMTSRPVRLFIAENKIPVDEVIVDLFTGEQYQPAYAGINPNSMMPMIEDGDLRLTESSAILKYLADKIGSPAYPKDQKQRAKVNEVMDWINTNFYREWAYNLCYPQLFPHLKRRSDEAQAATLEFGQQNSKAGCKSSMTIGSVPTSNICAATRAPSPTISAPRWSPWARSSAATSPPIQMSSVGLTM